MMGRLSITETNEQVDPELVGPARRLHQGRPARDMASRDPRGGRRRSAVSDWLADFGSLDRPDGILPGAQLRNVLQLRPGLT